MTTKRLLLVSDDWWKGLNTDTRYLDASKPLIEEFVDFEEMVSNPTAIGFLAPFFALEVRHVSALNLTLFSEEGQRLWILTQTRK